VFHGRGQRLTDEDDPEHGKPQVVDDDEEEQQTVVRTITFWSEGFTLEPVNSLRPFTDPRSVALLSSIRSGLAPLHELGVQPGQPVEMRVVHRAEEPYSVEKQARIWKEIQEAEDKRIGRTMARAFTGVGHRLGDLPSYTAPPSSSAALATSASGRGESVGFDAASPSARIQFRLADGTRHTIQFNSTQTVGDLYSTVAKVLGDQPVGVLLSGRPPVPLPTNLQMSLKEAGLEGSLIIQQ
jgi:UBX domain-containing protein 1